MCETQCLLTWLHKEIPYLLNILIYVAINLEKWIIVCTIQEAKTIQGNRTKVWMFQQWAKSFFNRLNKATLEHFFWLNIIGVILWQLSIHPWMYDGSFHFILTNPKIESLKQKTHLPNEFSKPNVWFSVNLVLTFEHTSLTKNIVWNFALLPKKKFKIVLPI